jgi:hypothetical protein
MSFMMILFLSAPAQPHFVKENNKTSQGKGFSLVA